MNVNKRLAKKLFQGCWKTLTKCQIAKIMNRAAIGNRDWVAFGRSGNASYCDDPSYPCPSIRFKENNNELFALREKEKGDWRKLSIQEKKILYRASFRLTFAEAMAPTGEWKKTIGLTLSFASLGLWLFILCRLFLYHPLPHTFCEDHRRSMLRAVLDTKMNCITGIGSKWDYEKDDWK